MTGPIELGDHRYGKERIRLVRVVRGPDRDIIRDLTVAVSLEGAFAAAYSAGDNAGVVATDTMKNTVYALASDHLSGPIEAFALALARHFVEAPSVERATVSIDEANWRPIEGPGSRPATAFVQDRSWVRTARITVGRAGASGTSHTGASGASGASGAEGPEVLIQSGLRDLTLMKTAGSSFAGFPRDRFTTLAETDDRLMATRLEAEWTYAADALTMRSGQPGLDFEAAFERVRTTLLARFADHRSPSVQATIWILGQAVLEAEPAIEAIHFRLPNLHHWLVDLTPFGMTNDGSVFVATGEPFGLIEGTVRRGDVADGQGSVRPRRSRGRPR
ncbi:MAG TPA: urate oxidase [Candidatus Limnocylindrales bacterium]|nr:urate oxidase [Candidatus Limnocylindrales bacterium]